jgi:hypothetical protein
VSAGNKIAVSISQTNIAARLVDRDQEPEHGQGVHNHNGTNPKFQKIDQMQLDNNSMIEATPSAPGPKLNSFNDCTWAKSCAAP